ncbi:hypothetical protein QQ045_006603 [Rhodiola kirilowii]
MARTMILVNKGLLGGGFTSIFKDFYGGLIICLLLFASIVIAAAQRGRRREHGHHGSRRGCDDANIPSGSSCENHDLESGQNGESQTNDMNQIDSEEDNNNDEIEVNEARATRMPRSHSTGDWGYPPAPDKRKAIAVGGGHIMDPTASRTMLSIIRQHWPVGCFTYRQANINTKGKFPETVLKEFRRYYIYEDGISDSQGNKDVLTYVDNRMRGMKTEEKNKAFLMAATNGKSIIDHKPSYFSTALWTSLCSHFLGPEHASKSQINKINRSKKVLSHCTGSTSHAKIKKDLAQKRKRDPTRLELFESTYKYKGIEAYSSEEARAIAERYKLILEERSQTLGEQEEEPIEWWIEAVGPIKKNRILGEPRILANEL